MSEENSHNNPWVDKLKHLAVPDVNDNWNNMQVLLDKEMPVTTNKNSNLKWLLLLLLLLLLIGVCNCPGLHTGNKTARKDSANSPILNGGSPREPLESTQLEGPVNEPSKPSINKVDNDPDEKNILSPADSTMNKPLLEKQATISVDLNKASDQASSKKQRSDTYGVPQAEFTKQSVSKTKPTIIGSRPPTKSGSYKNRKGKANINIEADTRPTPSNTNNDSAKPSNTDSNLINSIDAHNVPGDSVITKKDSTAGTLRKADTASSKTPLADSSRAQGERGVVIAIGLNQFFAIGGQQPSSFNSNGTSGVLGDYIPVPQLRYHFNKKLYVQAEAQFNTPQYTGNILARQSPPDSSRPGPPSQQSVYIKKLFYFNLPFSVHYSPVKNLYVGAGLQFSQLKNAVGLFENKRIGSTARDTGNTAKFQSLKSDDTTYSLLKTNEWRFLVDANYQWKRITLGIRYNQALNYFINVRISNTAISQSRNNSLQLYLRYDIWDRRR